MNEIAGKPVRITIHGGPMSGLTFDSLTKRCKTLRGLIANEHGTKWIIHEVDWETGNAFYLESRPCKDGDEDPG